MDILISPPDNWTRITDPDKLLEFSKELKLTPKTFIEPRPLVYIGHFTQEPQPCKLVGFVDKISVVISIAGQLHTIHPEYLLDMQSSSTAKEMRAQSDFFDFQQNEDENSREDEYNADPFEVPESAKDVQLDSYTVFDIESTGTNHSTAHIIELAALKIEDGVITDHFSQLVQPPEVIPLDATMINGITNEMVAGKPSIDQVLPAFIQFIGKSVLVGQNILFYDLPLLNRICAENGYDPINNPCCDTLPLARECLSLPNYKLGTIADALKVISGQAHRALGDCETTYRCFEKLKSMTTKPLDLSDTPIPQKVETKVSAQDLQRFKSRPRAKDIIPETDMFDPAHPLYSLSCVITGDLKHFSDRALMQEIANCGGINADNITRKTDLLIVGEDLAPEKKTGKIKKAEEYIAKGFPIRIITESELLKMLEVPAETETPEQSDHMKSEAERIYTEFQDAIAQAQAGYDLDKVQLKYRPQKSSASYYAIELFGQPCMNIKGTKNIYLEFSFKIDKHLDAFEVPVDRSRSSSLTRISISAFSFKQYPALATEIYEEFLMTNGFDCCSRYLECSEEERCIHPDIMMAGQCTYRQKLRAGLIFYGSKRNV